MDRTLVWILMAVALLLFVVFAVPLLMMGVSGMMGLPMMGPFPMMLFALLAPLVILGLIVVALARSLSPAVRSNSLERPLDALDRRYARGEIGRDEYERVRGDLQHG